MNNELLEKLLQSKKYRDICPDTVRRVWAECEGDIKKAKDVDKAARGGTHGIAGAFMTPDEARHLRPGTCRHGNSAGAKYRPRS